MHHFQRMYTCNKAINGAVITIYQMYSLFDTICFLIPQIILPNYFFPNSKYFGNFRFLPCRLRPRDATVGGGKRLLHPVHSHRDPSDARATDGPRRAPDDPE